MTEAPDPTFGIVCRMDQPLASIRKLGDALITEVIEEPGASAMNEIVHTLLKRVGELDETYSALFRLHHPSRDRFNLSGWPSDKSEAETPACA